MSDLKMSDLKMSDLKMSGLKSVRNVAGSIAIAGLLSIAIATPASAVSLFFFKGPTHAPNEKICTSFALDAAKKHNLQDVKHDNLSVSGTKDGFFAVMTCVGTFIVAMVAGDAGGNGGPLAQQLFDSVRHEVCIDGC